MINKSVHDWTVFGQAVSNICRVLYPFQRTHFAQMK